MSNTPTSVALLTPPGRGALATIAVHGPRAWEFVDSCLMMPVPTLKRTQRPWLRQFRGDGACEELVVAFPGENEARVHCHGGLAACEAVLKALEATGAVRATPPIEPISQALTERTALILLDQAQGAFSREIATIRQLLEANSVAEAHQRVATLLARVPLGLHLLRPWKVVIAGQPNAGKSSLLNALLGFQRSIVNPQPGTTRDVVTAITAFEGWPVELRDTAGLRESPDSLEAAGVKIAQREIEEANLVLLVIPANEPVAEHPALEAAQRTLVIRSKADLAESTNFRPGEVAVSAITGAGLQMLMMEVAAMLVPNELPAEAAVPITEEQVAALEQLYDLIVCNETTPAIDLCRQTEG